MPYSTYEDTYRTQYGHLNPGDMFFSHHRWWGVAESRRNGKYIEVRAYGSQRFVKHHRSESVKAQSMYPAGSGFGQYIK
jgi:hypothetical protein